MDEEISKRYYGIREVAAMFNVNPSVLRHWESEFRVLRPKKNRQGDRQFTEKDVEVVRTIYRLVREEGYTLQGAREAIEASVRQRPEKEALIESLEKLKAFLTELRDSFDKPADDPQK